MRVAFNGVFYSFSGYTEGVSGVWKFTIYTCYSFSKFEVRCLRRYRWRLRSIQKGLYIVSVRVVVSESSRKCKISREYDYLWSILKAASQYILTCKGTGLLLPHAASRRLTPPLLFPVSTGLPASQYWRHSQSSSVSLRYLIPYVAAQVVKKDAGLGKKYTDDVLHASKI